MRVSKTSEQTINPRSLYLETTYSGDIQATGGGTFIEMANT